MLIPEPRASPGNWGTVVEGAAVVGGATVVDVPGMVVGKVTGTVLEVEVVVGGFAVVVVGFAVVVVRGGHQMGRSYPLQLPVALAGWTTATKPTTAMARAKMAPMILRCLIVLSPWFELSVSWYRNPPPIQPCRMFLEKSRITS
jgi:hypothetical protein